MCITAFDKVLVDDLLPGVSERPGSINSLFGFLEEPLVQVCREDSDIPLTQVLKKFSKHDRQRIGLLSAAAACTP